MSEPHLHLSMPDIPVQRPTVEQVTFTKVTFIRGEGCCEYDPVRRVATYFDADGLAVFEDDPDELLVNVAPILGDGK